MKRRESVIYKYIILFIVAVLLAVFSITWFDNYNEEKLKENIHSEMWDIFEQEDLGVRDTENTQEDIHANYTNEGFFLLDYIEYEDETFFYYFSFISEVLVDTSEVLLEVPRYDDESKIAKVYKIKDTSADYMLAAEIEGKYYQYCSFVAEHDDLEEYINIRGGKEKLNIEYVEVILMEGNVESKKFIYKDNISEWVWDLLLSDRHDFVGWISCQCISGVEYTEYPKRNVRFNIYIRNDEANSLYKVYILPNGNVGICDGEVSVQETEYTFSASELLEAFEMLVNNYEAYEVN